MTTDLTQTKTADLAPLSTSDLEGAQRYAKSARSPNTYRAYRLAWERFDEWCRARGFTADLMAPSNAAKRSKLETALAVRLASHLAFLADEGFATATIMVAISGLNEGYRVRGFPPLRQRPEVREVLKGIRREKSVASKQAAALAVRDLRRICQALPDDDAGVRDRALILLGFGGAMRRSEIVALNVGDIQFCDDGLRVHLRKSKTDQEGQGAEVGVPFGSDPATCPVRAVRRLVDDGEPDGALFRSVRRKQPRRLASRDVGRILVRRAAAAGVDVDGLSAHSLRAGLATAAAKAGHGERSIMAQGRWSSRSMVDRYVRSAGLFDENAASGIGL